MSSLDGNKGGVFIPLDVLCDASLNGSKKILFSIILHLCETKAGCYASDDYFARRLGVGKRQLRRMLKELEDKELINRDGDYRRRYVFVNRENLNPDYGCDNYGRSNMS